MTRTLACLLAAAALSACGGDLDDAALPSDGSVPTSTSDAATGNAEPDGGATAPGGPDAGAEVDRVAGVCSASGVCWELPYPQGRTLHAVWAAAADDVWAVGEEGTVLRNDGSGWRGVALPDTVAADTALYAVHGSSARDVWIVGAGGVVLHHDGTALEAHDVGALVDGSAGAGTGTLYGVFAAGPDAVFAVGHSGVSAVIVRYDGSEWALSPLEDTTDRALRAVWGFDADDVWAVGDEGLVRRLAGESWESVHSPVDGDLTALHGLAPDDLWVVGRQGSAMRWDGERFIDAGEGLEGELLAVRVDKTPATTNAASADAGPPGVSDAGADAGASAARPAGPTRVWAFGEAGAVYGHDGARFWPVPSGLRRDLHGAWRLEAGKLLAVGEAGTLQTWQDGARRLDSFGSRDNRLALWGDGDALWVAGDELLRLGADGWTEQASATDRSLYGIWGDGNRVWAVGTAGTVVLHEDGAWKDVTPASADGAWLRSVWTGGASGFVVGHDGVALALEGDTWMPVETSTVEDLLDVWGTADNNVWAVGTGGKVLRWDGFAWVAVSRVSLGGVESDLRAVWGSAEDDVWVVGTLGTILHFDGEAWSDQSTGEGHSINDVWGFGPDAVYAVGSAGTLLRYDGVEWSSLDSGIDTSLEAVWGDPERGTLFVAGLDGVVLSLAR